ncbi:competence protein CoiA family protein [Streptomyces sp. NPDC005533]|uniref:competence protein CoiA family protein n=1 Tax=Streptomyces sp. NPDC005533 TaxID=3364723 RepID=UPI00368F0124
MSQSFGARLGKMGSSAIQTAVLGSPDSDVPVVCPDDPDELSIFQREYYNDTWWCGTRLPGGCGGRLTIRLCTDNVCHFVHYQETDIQSQCSPQSRGPESANHLFVKADFAAWLSAQGMEADFAFPNPVGSAVTARLEDGRVLLIHLDRDQPVLWNDQTAWEIFLGPGVRMDRDVLFKRGYVHRIRFDIRPGARRSVRIRLETPTPTVHPRWFDLGELLPQRG